MSDTREAILDAAAQVMSSRGLAHTTTKEIARAAGYSEATLYKHFRDKEELFLEVLAQRMPTFLPVAERLADEAGAGRLEANLARIAEAAIDFYGHSFPMAASIFSTPSLLAAHRDAMRRHGAGPHRPAQAVAAYLEAERQAGGVRRDADAEAAAELLVGGCLLHAFLRNYSGRRDSVRDRRTRAAALARTLAEALTP